MSHHRPSEPATRHKAGHMDPGCIGLEIATAASPGRYSIPGARQSRAAGRSAPSRASGSVRIWRRASNPGTRRIVVVRPRCQPPVPGCGCWHALAPHPGAIPSAPARKRHWAPCANLPQLLRQRPDRAAHPLPLRAARKDRQPVGVLAVSWIPSLASKREGRCRGTLSPR